MNVGPKTIRNFVDKEADYYIDAFGKIQKGKICWNWVSALFGYVWMAYRGMYLYAFLFWAFGTLLVLGTKIIADRFLPSFGEEKEWISTALVALISSVITGVIAGVWGNTLYFHFFKKRLSKGYTKEGTHDWVVTLIIVSNVITAIFWGLSGLLRLFKI